MLSGFSTIVDKRYTAGSQKDKYLEEYSTIQDGITNINDKIECLLNGEEARSTSAGTVDSLKLWDVKELKLREIIKSEIEFALRPIQRKLDSMEQQLNAMSTLASQEAKRELVPLRGVSREQAKTAIEELFNNTTDTLYYSDITEQLEIDLGVVISICDELLEEGKIKYEDEGVQTITRPPKSSPRVKIEDAFAEEPHFDDFLRAIKEYREEWDDEELNNE